MIDHAELIQNLRNLVKDGATPLRLIRDLLIQLADTVSAREVQEILAESFQLPIVRLGPSLDLNQKSYRQGVLNRTLLAEIVESKQRWDALTPSVGNSSWLDGLDVASPTDVREKLAADSYPGLTRESWAALSHDERQMLLAQLASGRVLSDRLEMLSRLAERLQEKIDELEGRRPMKPDIFSSTDGVEAQEKFQRWQAENPSGFYINQKSASNGMLHRVGCPHVGDAGDWDAGFGDVTRRAKVCHGDRAALISWAEEKGVNISMCADCRP